MMMVLPFLLGLLAAVFALMRQRNAAITVALVAVAIQIWWLLYHATDRLTVSL